MIAIPYGKMTLEWEAPVGGSFQILSLQEVPGVDNPQEEIIKAINNPLGSKSLNSFKGIKKVAIATADLTRPVPNKIILPILIDKLLEMGIDSKNITVIIGTGLHRVSPQEEWQQLLGEEVLNKVNVVSHNARDFDMQVNLGVTSRGTPVDINKYYAEADLKIVVGMIDPHQFQGFTGGAKGLAIGLGGKRLISANHSMLTDQNSCLGKVEGNPAREDIDEVGAIAGIDFVVNVVLNDHKEIVRAFAGDFREVHREGVKFARSIVEVPVNEEADIVIASPGGFPKDLNVYQAQKALAHSAMVVKKGGVIILVAECKEGVGEEGFFNYLKDKKTPQEVMESFLNQEFEMGPNKAFLWCRSLAKANAILMSDKLDDQTAKILMVDKCNSLDDAYNLALRKIGNDNPRVFVMPKASSTIPVVK